MKLSGEITDVLIEMKRGISEKAGDVIRTLKFERMVEPIKVICGSDQHWSILQTIACEGEISLDDLADKIRLHLGTLKSLLFDFFIKENYVDIKQRVYSIHKSIKDIFLNESQFRMIDVLRSEKSLKIDDLLEKSEVTSEKGRQLITKLHRRRIVLMEKDADTCKLKDGLNEILSDDISWCIIRALMTKTLNLNDLSETVRYPLEIVKEKLSNLVSLKIVAETPLYVLTRLGDFIYRLICLVNAYQLKGPTVYFDLKSEKSSLRVDQECDIIVKASNACIRDATTTLQISFPSHFEVKYCPEDWGQLNDPTGKVTFHHKIFLSEHPLNYLFKVIPRKAERCEVQGTCKYDDETIHRRLEFTVKQKILPLVIIVLALVSIPILLCVAYFFPTVTGWLYLASTVIGTIGGVIALWRAWKRYGKT